MRTTVTVALVLAVCSGCSQAAPTSANTSADGGTSDNSSRDGGSTSRDAGAAQTRDAQASVASDSGTDPAGNDGDWFAPKACSPEAKTGELYALSATPLSTDKPVSMCNFRGKVALVVNVASNCGYTPQYAPLQSLYAKYKDQGLVVLGFPSNQFGGQEPGSAEEISTFCTTKYKITFPMFAKTDVNGTNAHPVYKWLVTQQNGLGPIPWNFTKFLVDRKGTVVTRYEATTEPDNATLVAAIENALKASP